MEEQSIADFVKDAAGRTSDNRRELTIRELLGFWSAKRRGYWIVEQIERDLEEAGLTTKPHFTEGWIDDRVQVIPIANSPKFDDQGTPASRENGVSDERAPDVALRIGNLPSANHGITAISPGDSLEKAQSLMLCYDYSQLPVLSGARDLRGAVSWESIAQARLRNPAAPLVEATVPAEAVRGDDDLLAKIPHIMDAGYVFVRAADQKIAGIVTTADLSQQFATLAKPFFLLAEIERRLRRIIDRIFTEDDLQGVVDRQAFNRQVETADGLSLGEIVRLLEAPDRWSRLGWALDRKIFIDSLNEVRKTRNEVMHFSPDPLDQDQIRALENFIKWIRKLDGTS